MSIETKKLSVIVASLLKQRNWALSW